MLDKLVMVRRLKKDVLLKKLPTKQREFVFASISESNKNRVHAAVNKLREIERKLRGSVSAMDRDFLERERQGVTSGLRQLTGASKVDFAIKYILRILKEGDEGVDGDLGVEGETKQGTSYGYYTIYMCVCFLYCMPDRQGFCSLLKRFEKPS
jgi:hypothetical protein